MSDGNFPFESLSDRTLRRFKRAHVLQTADGTRINLDLNVSAATDEELIAAMRAKAESLSPMEPLPAAPEELWNRFLALPTEQRRRLWCEALPGMMRGRLSFVVLVEQHA